jgi:hypothetical protein
MNDEFTTLSLSYGERLANTRTEPVEPYNDDDVNRRIGLVTIVKFSIASEEIGCIDI